MAFFIGFGVIAITLFVVVVVVSVRRERERDRARLDRIHRWAADYGWTVATTGAPGWTARLPSERGERCGVLVMVSGSVDGRPVTVAEYFYNTESSDFDGDSTTTTNHLVVTAVQLPSAYPPIAVQPRGALSRLGRAMFGAGAVATGHDEFDRQFRVQTEEPPLARTLLGRALITEHLAGRIPTWDLAGQDLLTWQRGRLDDPRQIPRLGATLLWVADSLGR